MRSSYAIGVDVGGTRLAVGLVERKGRVLKEERSPTPRSGPFAVVDAIGELIDKVTSGVHPSEVAGVGVGLPAQIDFLKQSVEFCTNLPLAGIDVRSLVMSQVKHLVTIDNDGHCAGLGESRFGVARGVRDFLMVTLGTGVGGALFLNGEPYRGSRGLGGEAGHMVVETDGPECPCGGRGHVEAYLGRPAIAAKGRALAATREGRALLERAGGDPAALVAEDVLAAAAAGDDAAREIILEAGTMLGRALVGLVNLLNPKLVVVGGGIGASSPELVERAAEIVSGEALAGRKDVSIVRAELGNDAGVLGAAALAFDEHDAREGLHR